MSKENNKKQTGPKVKKNVKYNAKKTYRPKQKNELQSPRKEQLTVLTQRHNSIEPAGQSTDAMTLPAVIENSAIQQLFQATASYLYAFGSAANRVQTSGENPDDIFSGVAYLIDGIVKYASGAIETERMPYIYAVYASMLRARDVKFRFGKVMYTSTIEEQTYNVIQTLLNGDIYFALSPDTGDSLVLNATSSTIVPLQKNYTDTLSLYTRAECPLSVVIDIDKLKNVYKKDPSAFARTYAYIGSNGVAGGGLINDAELEVPFRMPSFSKFVMYDSTDTQISRVLKLQSGPAAMNLAFALTDKQFHEQHFKNPIPVIYKFLDLIEFYLYVTEWLVKLWSQMVITGTQFAPTTLPMSKYDFLILCRQAILSQFGASQLQGQFVQPLAQTTGSGSKFKPLVLDPATIPRPEFATFQIPSILAENLSMLKEASYCTTVKNKKGKVSPVRVTYVPVWGAYTEDEVPDIQMPTGEGFMPLFSNTSVLSTYASITDLRTSSINAKANPNCKSALTLLQIWNNYIQSVNSMAKVSTISSDVNYDGNLLIYTRISNITQDDYRAPPPTTPVDPVNKYVKNTVYVGEAKNRRLKTIAVANVNTTTILSVKPIPQELSGNLFSLLLPSLRLDITSTEDKMTQVAWQTYTGEVVSQPYTLGNGDSGINMPSRALTWAGHAITAQFAPSADQDQLAEAIQALAKHSWGADLFGQIASGLLGMVPVVGPILSNVVQGFF